MELVSDLERLEVSTKKLTLDDEETRKVGRQVFDYISNFWSMLPQYKAYEKDLGPSENIFEEHIGEGRSLKDVLKLFDDSVTHSGIQTASGGYLGYIPGGGIPLSVLGDFIAAATNKHVGVHSGCPGGVNIENHILQWAATSFGFDKEKFGGNLCAGGSIGIMLCMAAARDKHNIKAREYERAVVYVSELTHFCAEKALKAIGMRESVLRKIPVDDNCCINTSFLEKTMEQDTKIGLKPFCLVGTVGTTAAGSVDDIQQLSVLAKRFDCWLHVDGAYGGFFYLLDEMKSVFRGIEQADSLVIDPHKSLFMPYGSGIILVREREDLLRTFNYSSDLIDNSSYQNQSPADLSPELSRNFRGLRMWLPLLYHGTSVFKDALREKLLLTRYAYAKMRKFDFLDLGPSPTLSVFIFRFNGHGIYSDNFRSIEDLNTLNQKMMDAFRKDGRVFLTNAIIDGVYWLRVAVLCVRTHKREIDMLVDMIEYHFDHRTDEERMPH